MAQLLERVQFFFGRRFSMRIASPLSMTTSHLISWNGVHSTRSRRWYFSLLLFRAHRVLDGAPIIGRRYNHLADLKFLLLKCSCANRLLHYSRYWLRGKKEEEEEAPRCCFVDGRCRWRQVNCAQIESVEASALPNWTDVAATTNGGPSLSVRPSDLRRCPAKGWESSRTRSERSSVGLDSDCLPPGLMDLYVDPFGITGSAVNVTNHQISPPPRPPPWLMRSRRHDATHSRTQHRLWRADLLICASSGSQSDSSRRPPPVDAIHMSVIDDVTTAEKKV